MNQQHCEFYVVNETGTNMNFLWMRPKSQTLCALTLNDVNGKAVAKSYLGKETGEPLAVGLDIHQFGAKAVDQIDGILPLTVNTPVRVAAVNLTDLFFGLSSGEYRLDCLGRLYEITNTGSLTPVELPPVSLPLTIAQQPSEMLFGLRRLQSRGEFNWGGTAGALRVGLAHNFEPQQAGKDGEIEAYLMNTTTNFLHNLILPAPDQQFKLSLRDASGNEVPGTKLGAQQGKLLSLEGHTLDLKPFFLGANDVSRCARFNLNTFFEIRLPGQYQLTYRQRLYQIGADGVPESMILPVVEVPVQIQ